ncbi:MAG TPA: DUF1579 family protein [Vicinamibacterales bacterium]|nr:DUF1579 family protein [Vicinamibacterales bacterium]
MAVIDGLDPLIGAWSGTSRLYRPWTSPAESDSDSTAVVTTAAAGTAVSITYTWAFEGAPQEGVLLLTRHPEGQQVTAVWTDSWHMGHDFMRSVGRTEADGAVSVLGSYAAPPGPDWRWRTVLRASGRDAFELLMYNISPEGEEALAFHNRYRR